MKSWNPKAAFGGLSHRTMADPQAWQERLGGDIAQTKVHLAPSITLFSHCLILSFSSVSHGAET